MRMGHSLAQPSRTCVRVTRAPRRELRDARRLKTILRRPSQNDDCTHSAPRLRRRSMPRRRDASPSCATSCRYRTRVPVSPCPPPAGDTGGLRWRIENWRSRGLCRHFMVVDLLLGRGPRGVLHDRTRRARCCRSSRLRRSPPRNSTTGRIPGGHRSSLALARIRPAHPPCRRSSPGGG
jgi:hypothetical protein